MEFHPTRRRRRGAAGRAVWRLALLALPAVFWATIFARLAGVRVAERAVGHLPDAAHLLGTAAGPLVAVLLGCGTLRAGATGDRRAARLTLATGVALFACALAATLRAG